MSLFAFDFSDVKEAIFNVMNEIHSGTRKCITITKHLNRLHEIKKKQGSLQNYRNFNAENGYRIEKLFQDDCIFWGCENVGFLNRSVGSFVYKEVENDFICEFAYDDFCCFNEEEEMLAKNQLSTAILIELSIILEIELIQLLNFIDCKIKPCDNNDF
ncbi:hypothetical protein ABK040_012176 [Willaertia magna]